ncbi:MAG: urease accessory protein UreF [Actinomycetota bacterium]|jgi:urease accessory protein|nr:urease accessory protein UreF [Actinomycetota bacterium]MDQ3318835.1 urease accessory protein UreF [Actinomycetota bacterium]MDQ3434355.1 urease accessory protein UreF [Actinomycetota bacterium]
MELAALIPLLQLSDSAFPTGSFSHSMGLEALVEGGQVSGATELEAVVERYLEALATSDCVALWELFRPTDSIAEIVLVDNALSATKLARESRAASTATGSSLLEAAAAFELDYPLLRELMTAVRDGSAPGNIAVAYGAVCRSLGISVTAALGSYLYTAAAALVAAGQKLIPLGQSAAQGVLYHLRDVIAEAVRRSEKASPADLFSFAPVIEIASMTHERQRVRLYMS